MTDKAIVTGAPSTLADIKEYRGILSWIMSVDHKQIGLMYIGTSLLFFLLSVSMAIVMRTQLIVPENDPSLGTADYFLVVATVGSEEGSYGRNDVGIERPASGAACLPSQNLTSCGR